MSGKREKIKRRQKKIRATRFANELDKTAVRLWIAHKETNPHVKCNAEFQEKIDKFSPDLQTVS
jgi:hypothetical protein